MRSFNSGVLNFRLDGYSALPTALSADSPYCCTNVSAQSGTKSTPVFLNEGVRIQALQVMAQL